MSSENKSSGATFAHHKPDVETTGTGLKRWLLSKLVHYIGYPPIRIVLWDGTSWVDHAHQTIATVYIKNKTWLTRLILNPDLYFGEAYMAGDIEVEGDLENALQAVYKSRTAHANSTPAEQLTYAWRSWRRNNSMAGSRRNIHRHYDIGNHFYKLWLDREAMQYTCAYYESPEDTLEQAQLNKLEHVCRKLQLKPGQTVVEAGCGWGGLARYMARHYQVRVKAYNISEEQVKFAREKVREESLDHLVEYVLDDYRNINGDFDAFVSVGMLEHVGKENYPALGSIMRRVLKPDGLGLIHSIGRNYPAPMNAWIDKRIFPNAYPPSISEIMPIFEPNGLSILDIENLRQHYTQTLRDWLQRYEEHLPEIRKHFDEPFVRAWRLYLAGSAASFAGGYLQLFQIVFTHGENNNLSRTRRHLYMDASDEKGFHGSI